MYKIIEKIKREPYFFIKQIYGLFSISTFSCIEVVLGNGYTIFGFRNSTLSIKQK
jgi:hypothetical protein